MTTMRWDRRLFATTLAVLLAGAPALASAQSPTVVSGRVVREGGAPAAGATIGVEGTQMSALSNSAGRYSLSLPGTQRGPVVLTLRLIGYRMVRQTVTLAGQPITLDWALTEPLTQLAGVVVTALSVERDKVTIGTSQQALVGEALTRVQAPSVISSMSGKVSGVAINQSGNMGGSSRIVIRGAGSIQGENQPLFIVDGIAVSNRGFSTASAGGGRDYGTAISDLNPEDIETMTVLKGPNAAALYGSQASNGAVVITTKSGRGAAAGIKFNFTSRISLDQLSVLPDYQNQYGQGFAGEFQYVDGQGGGVNDGADESWGPKLDGRLIDQFHGKQQPWIAHPDNIRDFFRTGRSMSNGVNVTTSGNDMSARLSLTKDQVLGVIPNSSLDKLSGMLSANAVVKQKLTLSGSLTYVQSEAQNRAENGYTEGNPLMSFTWFGRQVDVQSLKNKYRNGANSPYGFAEGSLYNWNDNYHRNPYWQQYENVAPDSRDRVIGQVTANYAFTPWLSGLVRLGGDSYRNTTEEQFAKGNIDRADASFNGGFNVANSRARTSNVDAIVTARQSLGMFDLTLTGGGSRARNNRFDSGYRTSGILVEKIYNLANAGITPTFTNQEFHSAVNSAYGSAVVTVNDVWTVEATGRNDWSSTLPKENASYFYPSVSTSLVVSDLFPSLKNRWLSYLKLRGGAAQVGSDAAPYQLQTLYLGSSNKFGGAALYSLDNKSANAALKPERTTGSEAGIELSLFGDRVTIDGTYYLKKSRDQIINLTIPPATGFNQTVVNAGQITNRGIEALVTATILRNNTLEWQSTVNYTRNRNRVDELAPGLQTIIIASQWGANIEARRGEPYGVLFGYGYQRDSATGQLLLSGGLPLRATAKSILGNVNPDWVGGWHNEVRYKRFTLNALVDVRSGGQNFSVGNWWGMYAGILKSTLRGREEDWDKPGLVIAGIDKDTGEPNTTRVTAEEWNHSVYPIHEAAVLNTGFAKLREVRLGWDVPSSLASKARVSQLNVALFGRNLWTWTDFPNYDPENAANAGNGGQGFDMGALPTTRNFGFHVSIIP